MKLNNTIGKNDLIFNFLITFKYCKGHNDSAVYHFRYLFIRICLVPRFYGFFLLYRDKRATKLLNEYLVERSDFFQKQPTRK